MPSSLWTPSSYRGRDAKPLSPRHAPGDLIRDEFMQRANASAESRKQIMICREMRRNLLTVGVPKEWSNDETVRKVVEVVAPERQTLTLNMTNSLGAREPVWTRKAYGGTDTDKKNAEESEVFLNGARKQVFPWEDALGKGVEDGQYGFIGMPRPALLEKRPSYMQGDKPNPRYDRDKSGRGSRDSGYGERSSRASISAWRKDYAASAAEHFPVAMRVVNATDCVPIFQRGWGRQTYSVRGLLVRSLMERDELVADGYRWDGMDDTSMIPRGYVSGRSTGQQGQLFLYEMYMTHYVTREESKEDEGMCVPYVAYTVAGQTTSNRKWSDDRDSAVINLYEEFGMKRPTWGYFYGLHHQDDDFDYRGVPLLWPLVRYIWNKEYLLTAYLAHTGDNAFAGNIASIDPNVKDSAWLESNGQMRKFEKPKSNEIKMVPGPVSVWPQATVSADARYMIEEFRMTIASESDDMQQQAADSGHAMVVGDQLMKTAKRQIADGATQCSEFAGEVVAELCCGLERGEWKDAPKGVEVYVFADVERTLDNGAKETIAEAVRFKDSWFNSNYSITAKTPPERNLAVTQQLQGLYEAGLAKFEEVREALGDEHPETSFVEIQARRWLTTNPIGMLTVDIEVAHLRGMKDEAERLEAVLAQKLNDAGFPKSALAPEFQGGQQALPQGVALPDMGANVLGGAVAGEMGSASRQADAEAALAVAPGQGMVA